MLANLSVSKWTARKFDRTATAEVNRAHQAQDAGRYNKLLIDDKALKPITSAEGALRELHYKLTLPWGDNGDRLLPSRIYFDYMKQMREAKDRFDKAVAAFVADYPNHVQAARTRLGSLYNPNDYPSFVSDKFGVAYSFMPVPAAGDFRVDVGEKDREEIRAEITRMVKAREDEAVKDCWTRVRTVVSRYAERLRDPRAKVFQSMVDDARDLVVLLPALNLSNDPALNNAAAEIKTKLLSAPISALKTNLVRRAEVVAAAEAMLRTIP